METISRLSSVIDISRGLTLDAASAIKRAPPRPAADLSHLQRLLDSRHEREVLDGLRSLISLSRKDPSSTPVLFSAVLKNIASPSLAVKKLVYLYLLQNAESEPDTALLAINTIQKTLSASDPHVRALALRTMAGIRVPVISQIVSLGIKKGAADMSPVVRKAAALAIPKCWRLDPNTAPQLMEYLQKLLSDRQYFVVGPAVAAFLDICPDRLDLIHGVYRSLVRKLVDMDEWGQLATLRLLTVYARRCFPLRTRRTKKNAPSKSEAAAARAKAFYSDSNNSSDAEDESSEDTRHAAIPVIDPDLTLLFKAASNLLHSRNAAVIVSVTRLFLYCYPSAAVSDTNPYLGLVVGPLISLLRSPPAVRAVALTNIQLVATFHPALFTKYLTHFLTHATDPLAIQVSKSDILAVLFPACNSTAQSFVLTELGYITSSSPASSPLVGHAVRAIGRCAASSTPGSMTANRCLKLLLSQLGSPNASLVAESLNVVRGIVQADPQNHAATVVRLAKDLDGMVSPMARASVVWLVGEYGNGGNETGDGIASDVFRILVKNFADEGEEAKRQIVLLGAKCYLRHINSALARSEGKAAKQPEEVETEKGAKEEEQVDFSADTVPKLWAHLLHLVRYDTSYTLRDLARVYRALLPPSAPPPWAPDRATTQLASLLLLAPKPAPSAPSSAAGRKFLLGSASLAVGDAMVGAKLDMETSLPDWVEAGQEPDARLRGEEGGVGNNDSNVTAFRGTSASARLDAAASAPGVDLDARISSGPVGKKGASSGKELDDWLDESEEESDEEGEEGDEDDEDDEDEESEESSEESSSSDDESSTDDGSESARESKRLVA